MFNMHLLKYSTDFDESLYKLTIIKERALNK